MQKHFFIKILTLIFCFLTTQNLTTQAQTIRKYSNEFLSLGVGARALAMGNAQAAAANDVTAGYWNPAGLLQVQYTQAALMHAEWFAGISKYDYAAFAMPLNNGNQAIGASIVRFGIDDIPNTLRLVNQTDGSINYNNITTFSAADYGFLVSYSQKIKKLQVGANAKIVHRSVGSFAKSWGFGIDAGLQYKPNQALTLALMVHDLTTTFNAWSFNFTDEEKQILELTNNLIPVNSVELTGQKAVISAAYNLKIAEKINLLAALDADLTFDGKRNVLLKTNLVSIDPHAGIELSYNDLIKIRAGINNIQQIKTTDTGENITTLQPNIGAGIHIANAHIDYALTGLNGLNDGIYSHVFSLKFDFKKKNK